MKWRRENNIGGQNGKEGDIKVRSLADVSRRG